MKSSNIFQLCFLHALLWMHLVHCSWNRLGQSTLVSEYPATSTSAPPFWLDAPCIRDSPYDNIMVQCGAFQLFIRQKHHPKVSSCANRNSNGPFVRTGSNQLNNAAPDTFPNGFISIRITRYWFCCNLWEIWDSPRYSSLLSMSISPKSNTLLSIGNWTLRFCSKNSIILERMACLWGLRNGYNSLR